MRSFWSFSICCCLLAKDLFLVCGLVVFQRAEEDGCAGGDDAEENGAGGAVLGGGEDVAEEGAAEFVVFVSLGHGQCLSLSLSARLISRSAERLASVARLS